MSAIDPYGLSSGSYALAGTPLYSTAIFDSSPIVISWKPIPSLPVPTATQLIDEVSVTWSASIKMKFRSPFSASDTIGDYEKFATATVQVTATGSLAIPYGAPAVNTPLPVPTMSAGTALAEFLSQYIGNGTSSLFAQLSMPSDTAGKVAADIAKTKPGVSVFAQNFPSGSYAKFVKKTE